MQPQSKQGHKFMVVGYLTHTASCHSGIFRQLDVWRKTPSKVITGIGLWTSPAQAQQQGAQPSWSQPSPMVWKVRHATWVAFGGLSIIICHCLRPGAGPWEHSPACLCLRRPCVTSYGEHLLSSLCLRDNCVSLPSCRSIATSFLSQWPGRTKLRHWPSFVCKAPSLFHAFIINIVAVSVCSLFSIAVCSQ